ncbi:MAG: haloacid dehalogenase-like hydrolase [Gammaproteobacteria bacterium]|nr:haloacid dehalogenase-like hydrolase [Gammaproteobacteria bacterium]
MDFAHGATDPLPSWNDTASKRAIVGFVTATTTPTDPQYLPPAERIAVFDNDGTLWGEQPLYFQLAFALDRVKALAPEHPEWKTQEPFASLLKGDLKGALAGGEHAIAEMVMATHAGMTADEFAAVAKQWLATALHPQTQRRYVDMVYQPMLELLAYLRANGFRTFIVSGGGVDFLRVFAEEAYGITPEQVVGSSIRTKYELREGSPVIARLPEIDFIDDKAGKPVGIHKFIGRRPVLAFGNSDGDFEMLEWTTAGAGARLGLLLHHDDAGREFAYDRESSIGRLDRGLTEAAKRGWVVVSMKDDWREVFQSRGSTN